MESSSLRGHGESNFSSPLSHRMPTVSAAQALQDLGSTSARCVSTSLRHLNLALQNEDPSSSQALQGGVGGISRARITEIYGPPGVGKTALGIQLAVETLKSGGGVHWVDAAQPICATRFNHVLTATAHQDSDALADLSLNRLTHFNTPSLAHLLALLLNPTPTFLMDNVTLLIIDSFSTLISTAFPRLTDSPAPPSKPGAQKPSSRKLPILQHIMNSLQKIATTQNIAVVILSQCLTKLRPGAGAVLLPAINTTAWEQGLGARIALFRDWGWDDDHGKFVDGVRYAQVLKAEGIAIPTYRLHKVAFTIKETGLEPLEPPSRPAFDSAPFAIPPHGQRNPILPQKRKLAATDLEIPDSDDEDDEDYGWADEDEQELPAAPPQWQGSEDILITRDDQLDEATEADGEEDEKPVLKQGSRPTSDKSETNRFLGEIDDSEDELAL